MAHVLVTGASGFLGSHIADALSMQGHQVSLFDRVPSPYLRDDQQMILGDITDKASVEKAVAGQEYVYHLAALADLNAAKTRPVDTVEINVLGTVNLLKACVDAGVKQFMFGSSVYVFSREGGFYRCSKQACESYVEEFQNRYGLDYTILRYGSLYGTRTDMANGVYRLLYRYMNETEMSYPGTSSDRREYIHVLDAAKLSAQVIDRREETTNKTYVITGNDHLAISDLFKMFGEILDRKVTLDFVGDREQTSGHYSITPYSYTPKLGRKMVTNEYVDMGQGLIELIADIQNQQK
ncbi:UDP-glucose 4-epimerase [Lewinella aquimaris]|uniref:UDP-glucose 4-epimerase n=1 Tax=Neolewinella aquimaris TaxID=1835722 RepID=A0A840EEJ7_9BACT|nr:NAD(P)-dependent oxidoreductase [Neolewinella aquimaris]MBB4080229.1 UDP-glucose 4-epimerase [Neolewinella aquimaris]